MKHVELSIAIQKPFGNLYRKQCVLIAATNHEGEILVGAKSNFFPPTIARLLGGGVDQGEGVHAAAIRELEEELGIKVTPESLTQLLLFSITATDETGQTFHNDTHVFYADIGDQKFQAGDDVTAILALKPNELYDLGTRFIQLPNTLWHYDPEGMYSWADYAKMYGPIHQVVATEVKKLIALDSKTR